MKKKDKKRNSSKKTSWKERPHVDCLKITIPNGGITPKQLQDLICRTLKSSAQKNVQGAQFEIGPVEFGRSPASLKRKVTIQGAMTEVS